MKTIREWLNELPEGVRDDIFYRCNLNGLNKFLNALTTSIYNSVFQLYMEDNSVDSDSYWVTTWKLICPPCPIKAPSETFKPASEPKYTCVGTPDMVNAPQRYLPISTIDIEQNKIVQQLIRTSIQDDCHLKVLVSELQLLEGLKNDCTVTEK